MQMQIQIKNPFFWLTHSCFCLFFYVTSWAFPELRHQVDLDISLKAYVNTYEGNTVVCLCLDLTARLSVDTLSVFRVVNLCHVSCCHVSLHTAPSFLCLGSAGTQVCDLLFEAGGLSLQCSAHIAAGLPCCVDNTAGCRRSWEAPLQRREKWHENQVLTIGVGVITVVWEQATWSLCWNMEAATGLQPTVIYFGLYSCGKLDTVSPVNVLTGLLIWRGMLCSAEW